MHLLAHRPRRVDRLTRGLIQELGEELQVAKGPRPVRGDLATESQGLARRHDALDPDHAVCERCGPRSLDMPHEVQ